MFFNIAAELLSLANACGVLKRLLMGRCGRLKLQRLNGHTSQVFHS